MNVRELMQQRAKLVSQARALIDKADAEKRALSEDEEKQYKTSMAEIDRLNGEIERRSHLEGLEDDLNRTPQAQRPDPSLGLSPQEVQRYSIVRAINAMATSKSDPRALELASFEMEASRAVAQKLKRDPQGFFVPNDVLRAGVQMQRVHTPNGWQYVPMERRDLVRGTATAGGNLVATELLAASFIELLRNKMVLQRAGAQVLADLVGDIAIPKQTGGATAYWVAEGNAPTESQQTVGQATMAPKTVGAFTDMSRKLLKQASLDVEQFVRNDLASVLALAIDLAGLHGTGANNQPSGVSIINGVGVVYAGEGANNGSNPNGAAPIWADVVNLESAVAVANADIGNLAYITNAPLRGKMKKLQKIIATDSVMLWENNAAPLNGYPAFVTNQVRADLAKGTSSALSAMFFANWADLIFGLWGVLDVLVDPYTGGTAGTVRVIALQDVDLTVRHEGSFAVGLDFDPNA